MPNHSEFSLAFSRALGKVVVHIHGALDAGSAPALRDRLVDVIDGQGNRQVVLDLCGMTHVDMDGMLVLVNALKRMDEYDGELLLSGPTPSVAQTFRAAGLDEMFAITPAWAHPARGVGAKPRWEHDAAR